MKPADLEIFIVEYALPNIAKEYCEYSKQIFGRKE